MSEKRPDALRRNLEQRREIAESNEALAHLLGCLDGAADLANEIGSGADALVLEAHRAQLVRGYEWPGDQRIVSPFPPDLQSLPAAVSDPSTTERSGA